MALSKKKMREVIAAVRKTNGNREAAAGLLGLNPRRLREILAAAKAEGMTIPAPKASNQTPESVLREAWNAYERYGYNKAEASEAMNINSNTFRDYVKQARARLGLSERNLGLVHAKSATPAKLPKKGEVRRIFLTSMQNNTRFHDATWESLLKLADYYGAEIKIATFTYAPMDDAGSEKKDREKMDDHSPQGWGYNIKDRWYDPRGTAYVSDGFEELAPGLVWCGHHNTLPTKMDPLRGKENLNGRASGIFPHTRIEMRPVATMQGDATKFNFTTGTLTLRNYKQKDTGIIAEFYHCFGAALVEVDSDGNWWVRQLNADSEGTIYDIDVYSTPKGVWQCEPNEDVEAIAVGDVHRRTISEEIMNATWGDGGVVETLQPKYQVVHDLLDFESRSHHNRKDPHELFRIWSRGADSVWHEIAEAGQFLDYAQMAAPESKVIVVDSNHDRHFERFLKEVDWRSDMPNARTILNANLAMLDAIESGNETEFNAFEWACRQIGVAERAFFLNNKSEDPKKLSFVVCPGSGGGIEMGLHGDLGPNGARGSPRTLSKLGRKNVIGHSHSPGIYGGTYVAGVTGQLRQGYNTGPSSWAHAHVVVYKNGKRQVLLFWNNQPWAPR